MEVIGTTMISTFARYLLSKKPNDNLQHEGGLSKCQKKIRDTILQQGLKLNNDGDIILYLTFNHNETHLTFDKNETNGYYLIVHKFSKKEYGKINTIIFNEYISEVIDVVSMINEVPDNQEFVPWESIPQTSDLLGFSADGQIKLGKNDSILLTSFISMINMQKNKYIFPIDSEVYKKRGVERYTVYEKRGFVYLWDRLTDKSEALTIQNIFLIRPQSSALIADAKFRKFFSYFDKIERLTGLETSKIAIQAAVKQVLNIDMVFECRKFRILPYDFRNHNRVGVFYNYVLHSLGLLLIPQFKIDLRKRHTKVVNELVKVFSQAVVPPEKIKFNGTDFSLKHTYGLFSSQYTSKIHKYRLRMKKIEESMANKGSGLNYKNLSMKKRVFFKKLKTKRYSHIRPEGDSDIQTAVFKAHVFQKIVPRRSFSLSDVDNLFDAYINKRFIPNFSDRYKIGHIMRNEIFKMMEIFTKTLVPL